MMPWHKVRIAGAEGPSTFADAPSALAQGLLVSLPFSRPVVAPKGQKDKGKAAATSPKKRTIGKGKKEAESDGDNALGFAAMLSD